MVLGKGGLYPKHSHSRTVQRVQQKHLSVQEGPGRTGTLCPGDAIPLANLMESVFYPFSNHFVVQKVSPTLMAKVRQLRFVPL